MNDPRWFKLVIRALGVLTIAMSLPHLGQSLSTTVILTQRGPGGWTFSTPYGSTSSGWDTIFSAFGISAMVSLLASTAQLGLGIYLLVGAPRLVRYCVRQVGLRCPACDYDICGLKGACPECGLTIPDPLASAALEPSIPPRDH